MIPIGAARAARVGVLDAIPDGLVDNFEEILYEDQDNILSDYYAGDLTAFERQQTTVIEGDFTLKSQTGDSSNNIIKSTSGLALYPSAGDLFRYNIKTGNGGDFIFGYFGVPNADNSQDGYAILTNNANGGFAIRKDGDTIESTGVEYDNDRIYTVEVDWAVGGTISGTLFDDENNQLAEVSATDTKYESGGIGWGVNRVSDTPAYWDDMRVIG